MDLICCNFRSQRSGNKNRDEEEEEGADGRVLPLPPPPLNGRNAFVDGSLGAVNRTYM